MFNKCPVSSMYAAGQAQNDVVFWKWPDHTADPHTNGYEIDATYAIYTIEIHYILFMQLSVFWSSIHAILSCTENRSSIITVWQHYFLFLFCMNLRIERVNAYKQDLWKQTTIIIYEWRTEPLLFTTYSCEYIFLHALTYPVCLRIHIFVCCSYFPWHYVLIACHKTCYHTGMMLIFVAVGILIAFLRQNYHLLASVAFLLQYRCFHKCLDTLSV